MNFDFTTLAGTIFIALALIVTGCSDSGNGDDDITISSLSSATVQSGQTLTINGAGFSSTPSENIVTFTGGATADVTASTASQLTVTVPQNAQNGPITVQVGNASATSSSTVTIAEAAEVPQVYQDLPGKLIAGDEVWASDTTLTGPRFILPGVTLTVEEGVEVSFTFHNGNTDDVGTIITLPGDDTNFSDGPRASGRLVAVGAVDNPVVFTSDRKQVRSWGGIILAGRASNNIPGGLGEIEGLSQAVQYGAPEGSFNDEDSSGQLSYVRIEYSGFSIDEGSELQALTLYSVGSGTQLDHINLFQSVDDGVELFGGTVDIKYLAISGAQDDTFDYDNGWTGRGQFWVGVQTDGTPSNRGFENDGCDEQSDCNGGNGPTSPQIYNVTMYGNSTANGEDVSGIYLREGLQGEYKNIIIANFNKDSGLPIEVADDGTAGNIGSSLTFGGNITFNNMSNDYSGLPYSASDLGLENVDPQFTDVLNFDFSLQNGSPALSGGETPPSDDFFDQVSYRGAFDTNDWTQEGTWVRWN